MNQFGGGWTQQKIDIVSTYAAAYLTVFKNKPQIKLLYFDGFAGAGQINTKKNTIEGAALKILNIDHPRRFDTYYFVELDPKKCDALEAKAKSLYPNVPNKHFTASDCNEKLKGLRQYLMDHPEYKALVFIDPCGMEVNWSSIALLKGLPVDLWLLIPTGMGTNRLLRKDGKIPEAWLTRLEIFLGMPKEEIVQIFYNKYSHMDLFSDAVVTTMVKDTRTIQKIHQLYKQRLETIFDSISDPFVIRNSKNSIMFHFLMATNNNIALKIANSVIKPYKI